MLDQNPNKDIGITRTYPDSMVERGGLVARGTVLRDGKEVGFSIRPLMLDENMTPYVIVDGIKVYQIPRE